MKTLKIPETKPIIDISSENKESGSLGLFSSTVPKKKEAEDKTVKVNSLLGEKTEKT